MQRYSSCLVECREWLKRIGKARAKTLRSVILDIGEWNLYHYTKVANDEARYSRNPQPIAPEPRGQTEREWWTMARKLESKILGPHMTMEQLVAQDPKDFSREEDSKLPDP